MFFMSQYLQFLFLESSQHSQELRLAIRSKFIMIISDKSYRQLLKGVIFQNRSVCVVLL